MISKPFTFSMTVLEFLQRSVYFDNTGFIEDCKVLPLPEQWIQDLSKIKFGQRIDLSELKAENLITLPLEILHGLNEQQISELKAGEVIRFSVMVAEGLSELNQRDEKYLKYEPDQEEVKAGVKKMNHGLFGVIDTIAKRCPQYTHDQVLELSQAVVFQMLKIDIDNVNYSKRLRKIISEKK